MRPRIIVIVLAVIVALAGIVASAAIFNRGEQLGTDGLKARALNLDIRDGGFTQDVLEAREGEIVTLKVTSDKPWLLHLHTIEVADEIRPGEVLLLPFEASLTGRFEIKLHSLPQMTSGHQENGTHDSHSHKNDEGQREVLAGYINILPE